MSQSDFTSYSYKKHETNPVDVTKIPGWKDQETVDNWRHQRMYSSIDPMLDNYPKATWLTVGDGRYGTDAHYISQRGLDVMATDISGNQLRKAKEDGHIRDYKIENAEKLSFKDGSYDFVLCKESYHHFPRPMVALYEMLRVARLAVILIEPNDPNLAIPQKANLTEASTWFWMALKNWVKGRLGRKPYYEQGRYETIGNYVYTISTRELEKVALGMNFPMITIKGMNDYYVDGGEFEKVSENGPILKEIKGEIGRSDKACRRGHRTWAMLAAAIFKEEPNPKCQKALSKNGYWINNLQRNPHLNGTLS